MIGNLNIIFFNTLLFLTPLAEYLNWFFYIAILLSVLIILNKAKFNKKDNLFILLIILIAILAHGPLKGILSFLIFLSAFVNFREFKIANLYSIYFLLVINFFFVTMQFLGYDELFYAHVNYGNNRDFNQLLISENFHLYLPQVRPSGIFPAPTFISYFLIFIFSTFIYYEYIINKYYQLIAGSLMALVGSTMGLFVIILFLINYLNNKKLIMVIIGYLITMILYKYFNSYIFDYNFSYHDLMLSLANRGLEESIIKNNIIFFLFISLLVPYAIILIIKDNNVNNVINIGSVLLIFFVPIILHDFTNSLLSFYFFGVGFGLLKYYINIKLKMRGNFRSRKIN